MTNEALDSRVTLNHIRAVLMELPDTPIEDVELNVQGLHFHFDMSHWSQPDEGCGTAHCLWGGAYLLANKQATNQGPRCDWYSLSRKHDQLDGLFQCSELAAHQAKALGLAILDGAIRPGVDLSEADLEDIDLRGIDLRGTNFGGVNLNGAYLQGANLSGVNLVRAELKDANLEGANLEGADLDLAELDRANFRNANLKNAALGDSDLYGTVFDGADLTGASVSMDYTDEDTSFYLTKGVEHLFASDEDE